MANKTIDYPLYNKYLLSIGIYKKIILFDSFSDVRERMAWRITAMASPMAAGGGEGELYFFPLPP